VQNLQYRKIYPIKTVILFPPYSGICLFPEFEMLRIEFAYLQFTFTSLVLWLSALRYAVSICLARTEPFADRKDLLLDLVF